MDKKVVVYMNIIFYIYVYVYIHGLLFSQKKNEISPFLRIHMEFEVSSLSKVNQREKDHMISLICGILKKRSPQIHNGSVVVKSGVKAVGEIVELSCFCFSFNKLNFKNTV